MYTETLIRDPLCLFSLISYHLLRSYHVQPCTTRRYPGHENLSHYLKYEQQHVNSSHVELADPGQ